MLAAIAEALIIIVIVKYAAAIRVPITRMVVKLDTRSRVSKRYALCDPDDNHMHLLCPLYTSRNDIRTQP